MKNNFKYIVIIFLIIPFLSVYLTFSSEEVFGVINNISENPSKLALFVLILIFGTALLEYTLRPIHVLLLDFKVRINELYTRIFMGTFIFIFITVLVFLNSTLEMQKIVMLLSGAALSRLYLVSVKLMNRIRLMKLFLSNDYLYYIGDKEFYVNSISGDRVNIVFNESKSIEVSINIEEFLNKEIGFKNKNF